MTNYISVWWVNESLDVNENINELRFKFEMLNIMYILLLKLLFPGIISCFADLLGYGTRRTTRIKTLHRVQCTLAASKGIH